MTEPASVSNPGVRPMSNPGVRPTQLTARRVCQLCRPDTKNHAGSVNCVGLTPKTSKVKDDAEPGDHSVGD